MSASLMTVAKAAALLDISLGRCYALIRSGALPAVRIGRQVRVSSEALDAFIAGGGFTLPSGGDDVR